MKLLRPGRKKNRVKKAILKEVFTDNLRMAEKAGNYRKQRKKKNLVKISSASFLAILIYFFMNHFAFLEHTLFRDNQTDFLNPAAANRDIGPGFNSAQWGDGSGSSVTPSQYIAFLNTVQMPLQKIFGLKVKRILIDPGHGGEDPGTTGKLGTKEKDITLDIAGRLRDLLRKRPAYQVLMTRERDVTLSLNDRVEIANSCKADLFISIHLNYIPNKPINIIETYYFGPHTDKQALLLAEKENRGTEYTLNDFKEIIRDIENTLKTQESNSLAFFIQKSLYRNIRRQNKNVKDFGIKSAPFIVLLGVDVPGVLAEVTCLSNTNEEKKLNKEYYRKKIALYLEEGIVNYLNKNQDKGDVIWSKKKRSP